MTNNSGTDDLGLKAGDWVVVKSKEEILRTLDKNGQLDRMPFMPEMLQYAGQRLQVSKRAHKTCDPMNTGLGIRALPATVHIGDLRCDGSAHAGCQAGCLLYFKEAWLKRDGAPQEATATPASGVGCNEDDLTRGTLNHEVAADPGGPTYLCQATQVGVATRPLKWYAISQYVEDYTSGNASLKRILNAWLFWIWHNIASSRLGLGTAMRWLYDKFQKLIGGTPYPWRLGEVPAGTKTPTQLLDIKEGELVRTKPYREILKTLDIEWRNRGLYFDAEMVPYTERTMKVLKRVTRIIDEKTGKMLIMKNPCLILDGSVCAAKYAKCRKLCPRGYYLYWREIWVDRIADPDATRSA
jgi:hypothetical protein